MISGIKKGTAICCAALLIASCHMPGSAPITPNVSPVANSAASPATPRVVLPLTGHVSFAAGRHTQATMTDVAYGATVSLINTGTNQTVSTALTDVNGNFTMNFTGGFTPDPTVTYYLEAYKGLGSNLPSYLATRVRTLVQFNTGWTSISSSTPNATITVNTATTALAIAAALRNSQSPFTFSSLIGTLNVSGGNLYSPVAGISNSDYLNVTSLVNQTLAANMDPVANVGLSGSNWLAIATNSIQVNAPVVSSITPPNGSVGTSVTIAGSGFSTTLGNNTFKFNAGTATLTSATTTQLQGSVPYGATSGQTTLQVGSTTVLGPLFTVVPVLSGMSPSSGVAGTNVTLTGSGFDLNTPSNNIVTFAGVAANVVAVNGPTSITVTVPVGASTGQIRLTVAGSPIQSSGSFTVPMTVTSMTPNPAAPGTQVAITGSGFSSTPASNSVTLGGVAATVISASPNALVVAAPTVTTPGPAVVTVGGVSASSVGNFSNPGSGSPLNIYTYAGAVGLTAGQPAIAWPINNPQACFTDAAGNLYISGAEFVNGGSCCWYWSVGKISTSGVYSRIAGANGSGNTGDGGSALSAQLNTPWAVAVDSTGSVYIADSANNRVRMVSTSGIITNFAGSAAGTSGYSGDGGAATGALLNNPDGIAVDSAGNVYIAEWNNSRVRKVSTSGIITTVAGTASAGFSGDGGLATNAQLNRAGGITLDSAGNLYIADNANNRIRKVTASTGIITTVAGNGNWPFAGDGGLATAAQINGPTGVAVDGSGNLYIVDQGNSRIRMVTASTGNISTIAGTGTSGFTGDGGTATSAQLNNPQRVAVDGSGNVYITDQNNAAIRKVAGGIMTTIMTRGNIGITDQNHGDGASASFAGFNQPYGVAVATGSGNVYIADYANYRIRMVNATTGNISTVAGNGNGGFAGDGGAATSAQLNRPYDVLVDGAGNLYIADTYNHRIRMVNASTGNITTIAGTGASGFGGDGGQATSAMLNYPQGLALDIADNLLFISDTNNNRIRQVNLTTGVITTVAGNGGGGYGGDGALSTSATLNNPVGIAFASPNILYIADWNNQRVRKAIVGGNMSTVAGNGSWYPVVDNCPGTQGTLYNPWGVRLDGSGNLYISDYNNNRIRKLDAGGNLTTYAGTGGAGWSGDGGAPINALLNHPAGLAVNANNQLIFADYSDNHIRWIH
jgi:sugar lactone lactonase YvrE